MCRRVHTDMSGSPQWIAFTRPTTTDIPTFIHRLYASLRVYLHIHVVKEHIYILYIYTSVPRQRRFDQIYVSTAGVPPLDIKAFNIAKRIDISWYRWTSGFSTSSYSTTKNNVSYAVHSVSSRLILDERRTLFTLIFLLRKNILLDSCVTISGD